MKDSPERAGHGLNGQYNIFYHEEHEAHEEKGEEEKPKPFKPVQLKEYSTTNGHESTRIR